MARFCETLRDWTLGAAPDGPLNLAIFFDAAVVAGDAGAARRGARLARPQPRRQRRLPRALRRAPPTSSRSRTSWWSRLTARADEQALDLKKLGTFPIVHGVRALCLRHRVNAVSTAQRLQRLVELGHLDAALARDLTESLHYLMGLRLRRQLQQRAAGGPADNLVQPAALSTMERDQLKDALAITRRFRVLLRERFRLDAFQ